MIVKMNCYRCGKTVKIKANNIKESKRIKREGNYNTLCECCEDHLTQGLEKEFKRYKEDAIGYIENMYGINLYPYQKELLKCVIRGGKYIHINRQDGHRTQPNAVNMLYKFM